MISFFKEQLPQYSGGCRDAFSWLHVDAQFSLFAGFLLLQCHIPGAQSSAGTGPELNNYSPNECKCSEHLRATVSAHVGTYRSSLTSHT